MKAHEAAINIHPIEAIIGLREELKKAGGSPVLSAVWVQKRDAMWEGHVASDGQLLNRVDYPDAWAAISNGKVPVVADDVWLADPYKRGSFTAGNGTTTFRVPDYNGKYPGSIGALFQRGDGLNSAGTNGLLQGDAIRDIEGVIGGIGGGFNRAYDLGHTGGGVFANADSSGYDLGDIKGFKSQLRVKLLPLNSKHHT